MAAAGSRPSLHGATSRLTAEMGTISSSGSMKHYLDSASQSSNGGFTGYSRGVLHPHAWHLSSEHAVLSMEKCL